MSGKLRGNNKHAEPGEEQLAGKKKVLKKVKQRNHDEYVVPSCMVPWANEPLYLMVAHWGLKQKQWINRNDIAAVFHIPERQASFQLSYISRKKERITSRTRYMRAEENGHLRVEIFIDAILPVPEDGPTLVPPRRRNVPAGPVSRGVGSGMAENTGLWERLLKGCRRRGDDE
ncbi:TPA: CaiF/GrlA family transcriptional regulator [Salmonella enterica subsp. houtenae]|nr:CaiF/GrlA family transcriptional regulator [Salmonella enterica subsp. houtenae]